MDCLRRTGGDLTQARPLPPGMFYQYQRPRRGSWIPVLTQEAFQALADSAGDTCRPVPPGPLFGPVPLLARELAFEAFGETDAPRGGDPAGLYARLSRLLTQVEEGKTTPPPSWCREEPVDVSFRPILQYGPTTESRSCQTFGALLDQFYQEKETAERVRQKGQDFLKTLNHARERLVRKMALRRKSWRTPPTGNRTGCTATSSPPTSTG